MDQKYHILYVDDEESNLRVFRTAFKKDFQVYTALTAEEGIAILKTTEIHLVVTDQRMPNITGVEFLARIIPDFPDPVRMILTGFSDAQALIEAINSGRVYRYVTKPWNKDELKVVLDEALHTFQLEQDKRKMIRELRDINLRLESEIKQLKMELKGDILCDELPVTTKSDHTF